MDVATCMVLEVVLVELESVLGNDVVIAEGMVVDIAMSIVVSIVMSIDVSIVVF